MEFVGYAILLLGALWLLFIFICLMLYIYYDG